MIYVASPYSSPIREALQQRFEAVREFTRRMIGQGFVAFSPIVYAHEMAKGGALPTDANFWLQFNSDMLRRAEAMYVLDLIGWDKSKGVAVELKQAAAMFIPVAHYQPTNDGMHLRFKLASPEWAGALVEEF